jgi:hypothetical protein
MAAYNVMPVTGICCPPGWPAAFQGILIRDGAALTDAAQAPWRLKSASGTAPLATHGSDEPYDLSCRRRPSFMVIQEFDAASMQRPALWEVLTPISAVVSVREKARKCDFIGFILYALIFLLEDLSRSKDDA